MKYFNWLSKALLLFALVAAVMAQAVYEDDDNSEFNFEITTRVMASPEENNGIVTEGTEVVGVPQMPHGEETLFKIKFINFEDVPVQLVALGGTFYDPKRRRSVAELRTTSFKPQLVGPNQSIEINQKVRAGLNPDDYFLALNLHLMINEEKIVLATYEGLVSVIEKGVSFFDPQFIAVILILGVFAAVLGYYARNSYLKSAVVASSRVSSKPDSKKGKKASGGSSTALDESWLPSEYSGKVGSSKKVKKSE